MPAICMRMDARGAGPAAGGGHLECLRYAHENGCPWDVYTCASAAGGGHLECLRYAHENGCPWGGATCASAAGGGHLECLRYAHENGCPWGGATCASAARGGHLECLRYAHENGCPWDGATCASAARGGHLECLRYAHEKDARGTCTPAGQQPGEGIWSAFAMHMRMDARGAGPPPACMQPREGIWSACDMHMRMDARGTGPSAGQQPGEGIWSAFAMHATTDARVPRAVDTCESSNLRSHSRSTTSVATKIDLASRVPRASCPTLEESRRRRTAPALSAISSPHASLMATTPMSANTPPRAVSTDTTLISLHPPSSR